MENQMEKSNAAKILSSRKLVVTEGYVELRATSIVPNEGKFIVNFSGMTQYHKDEALKLMGEGKFQEAVNQNITASLRPTDYIPEKGEICKIYIERITTNNRVSGLFPTSVAKIQANKVSKVTGFDAFLEDSTAPAVNTLEAEVQSKLTETLK